MLARTDRAVLAHLFDDDTSLVIGGDGGMPEVWWWGRRLDTSDSLAELTERAVPHGGLDIDAPFGFIAESARGWFGRPGIEGWRAGGLDFAPRFALTTCESDRSSAAIRCDDAIAGLSIELVLQLVHGVLRVRSSLTNEGADAYQLSAFRIGLPVADSARELLTVGGRHAFEFVEHRTEWQRQCITVENRYGKTSHEHLGAVFAGTPGFAEQSGEVWAVHLGWSGNFEFICDSATNGRRVLQVGELLLPGELSLEPGQRYQMADVFAVHSAHGLNPVSNTFHEFLRARPEHPKSPRPVHLNTWEAVYFDHDLATLTALADRAAEIGIERFVLDDGWFGSRRDDTSGLGDWWVSADAWPDGLTPLVHHVVGCGMEFGIWFEPEMVNPDSDLYRAHPEWALVDQRYPHVLARHQLMLDLGRAEVRDYLFEQISAVLASHPISYVKWDHNRDLVSPATRDGGPGARSQTLGVYELLDRLRQAHPTVEFETCASGGGRADFGILERTERVWTSDSIDAFDRQTIQHGFSLLFPPELMGSHVGDRIAHTTHRSHDIGFRAMTAVFGAFGVESNLLKIGPDELEQLASAIQFYKQHRDLLHHGTVVRVDHPDPTVEVHGVVNAERSEAIFAVARLSSGASHHSAPLAFVGLDPERQYRLEVVSGVGSPLGPSRSQPAWVSDGLTATGGELLTVGVQIPQLFPESGVLLILHEQ